MKEVFLYRYHHSSAADRGFVSHILSILHELDLPSIPELLSSLPSNLAWKSHVKAMLYVRFQDLVLEAANHMPSLADVVNVPYNLRAKPINLVACFRGDVSLARLNNFRFRLLTHCPGLNKDTAVFHPRINRSRDPICGLCKSSVEDNRHFICDRPALQQVRDSWLPKLSVSSNDVLSHVLGGVWIKDTSFQRNIVCFLKDLRSLRLYLSLFLPPVTSTVNTIPLFEFLILLPVSLTTLSILFMLTLLNLFTYFCVTIFLHPLMGYSFLTRRQ